MGCVPHCAQQVAPPAKEKREFPGTPGLCPKGEARAGVLRQPEPGLLSVRVLTGEAHTQWTCPGEEGPGSPHVTRSDAPEWLPHRRGPGFGVVMPGQAVHGGGRWIHEEPRDGFHPSLSLTWR